MYKGTNLYIFIFYNEKKTEKTFVEITIEKKKISYQSNFYTFIIEKIKK